MPGRLITWEITVFVPGTKMTPAWIWLTDVSGLAKSGWVPLDSHAEHTLRQVLKIPYDLLAEDVIKLPVQTLRFQSMYPTVLAAATDLLRFSPTYLLNLATSYVKPEIPQTT